MAEGEQGFRIAAAYVEVSPDTSGFREKLQADLDEAVDGVHADVSVGLDTSELDAKADDVKAKVSELDDLRADPEVGLITDDLDSKADDAKAKVDELDQMRAEPEIGADKSELDAKVDQAKADLDDLDARRAEPELGAENSDFEAKIAAANAQLTALNARSANPTIGGSGGGGGLGEGESGGEGSLIGALGLGMGALLPGIAPAVAGMGLLGGTGLAAFGGIGKALEAHSQASQAVGQTSQQLAATAFSDAVAVQQAQQEVQQAYEQSAMVARNAALAQAQAMQAVTQANQQEQEASFGLTQAQYNLSQAWIQAKYNLEQLRDEYDDEGASIQAAKVALQEAQYQQQLTDENAMSTALDRAQAAVAVTQAQEGLTAAQQQASYTTAEYNSQEKAGVAGSQQVITAREAVKEAVYAVRDAEDQVKDAQLNLIDTELNNADQMRESQRQVAEAVKNVSDTIKEQRLENAATASTANQAADQYEKDFAKLSAPARRFVSQLLSMHGAWTRLEHIAQGAVLPGMSTFLNGVKSIMPEIDSGVRRMGRAMSDSFGSFGKLMQTSAFKEGLSGLLRNGVQFTDIVLPAFAQFLQTLGKVGGSQGAATGLANLLAGVAHGLTGMVSAIRPYIPAIDQFLSAVGKIVAQIGPPLARIVGLVAQALSPLTRYLNSHPNGTLVKVIGDLAAGMLAFKGLQKMIPFGSIASGFSKIGGVIKDLPGNVGKLAKSIEGLPGKVSGIFPKIGKWFSELGSNASTVASNIAGAFSGAWSKLSTWGSQFGTMVANAASSVAQWVSGMVAQIGEAATATGAWIAEHAVATAEFVAQNVAQAASATAAFVAENAATLGIAAAIAALITVIVLVATHWKAVWGTIKDVALDLWHNVLDPMWQGIEQGLSDLYDYTIKPLIDAWVLEFKGLEDAALYLWHEVFDPVWHGIMDGVHGFESAFGGAWDRVESIFKKPVNFLISTVYDDGIKRFWNDIVTHIGLGALKLPTIPALAGGGIVPGQDSGHDNQLVAMRSGEGVLVPEAVQAIGPGTVHALNKKYGGSEGQSSSNKSHTSSGSSSSSSGGHLGKEVRRMGERVARRGGEHLLGFSGGGVLGDIGNFFSSVGHGIMSTAEFMNNFAADPVQAVESALTKLVRTPAAGDLAHVMTAIPKTLISDLAHLVSSGGSGSGGKLLPGGSSGAIGGLPGNWHTIASFLASHGFTKFAAAGVTGNIDAESGGNPEILEIGGGGGGGLIQWTPYPPGYITGNVQQDLMTQLNAILSWGGGPALVNRATSPSNAALIYQDYYERPASLTASLPQRMASANAVYKAMDWGSYDQGGWLMPGGMPGYNATGQPEAVLTPQQSQALTRLAQNLPAAGSAGMQPVANFNYYGTQYPTVEQRQLMQRDLAMAFSGVAR